MQSALYSYQDSQAFKIIFKIILIAFVSLAFCDTAKSETQLTKKDKLKAAYLLNFTRFIEWPNNTPEIPPAPIRICVEDSPEFLLFFNQMSANRKSGPLQQTVKAYLSNTVDGCELLYVKESSKDNFEKINASLTENTVIVSDSDKVSFPGTSITFYEQNKNLRFEIDLQQLNAANVSASSELLKLARIK